MQGNVKGTVKDSIFCNLFKTRKYLLQLYQALHPEDYSMTEDGLENITINHVFFDGKSAGIELKARVIYAGKGNDIINQYVKFTKVYNEQVKKHGKNKKAVLETIRICKDKDLLKEYLESKEKEVKALRAKLGYI